MYKSSNVIHSMIFARISCIFYTIYFWNAAKMGEKYMEMLITAFFGLIPGF